MGRPEVRRALLRVLERSPEHLPRHIQGGAPAVASVIMAAVDQAAFVTRALSDPEEIARIPAEELSRLARDFSDLLTIRVIFGPGLQSKFQNTAALLQKVPGLDARRSAAFQQALQWLERKPDDGADGVRIESLPASPERSGLGKSGGADELLALLPDADDGVRPELLAALCRLPSKQWTDERKDRLREIFMNAKDASLRRDLLGVLRGESLGLSEDALIAAWLYPQARAEIFEFYSHRAYKPKWLEQSMFLDPPVFRAWVDNVRRMREELSPEAYARMKEESRRVHTSANFFFPFRDGRPSVKEDGYFLPYSLKDSGRPEGKPAPSGLDFMRMTQSIAADEQPVALLRAKHALFDRLINANYQTLESMSGQAESLTRASVGLLLSQTRRMAELYHRLRGDSPYEAKISSTQTAYERIKEKLRRRWRGLAPEEKLSEKPVRLVLKLDPERPLRSLNALINWMHQKALGLFMSSGVDEDEASGSIEIREGKELPFLYIGRAPLREAVRRNQILRALQAEAPAIGGLYSSSELFFDEHRIWLNLHLGCHSAEISADSSAPDEGGMLRIRYKESGFEGSKYRLNMIAAFLEKLGLSVKVEGSDYLDAVLDKDHGLDSERSLAEIYPFVIRFLCSTKDLDLVFGNISFKKGKGKAKAKKADAGMEFSSSLGEVFLSEGRWPFSITSGGIKQGYKSYLKLATERAALAGKLNAELGRLGLPRMPADVPFGQRAIDRFFTKPILEAAARGQLQWDGVGKPERRQYSPLFELAQEVLAAPGELARSASILETADASLLDYEPIGQVGALSAERGQKFFEDGSALSVLALRDPASGRWVYAKASLRKASGELESLSPSKFLEFLRKEDLLAGEGEGLSAAQQRSLQSLLAAPIPKQSGSEQAQAYGLSAAPGSGQFVTGHILFDRAKQQEGAVLAVPYTSPDDMEAISRSAAVLTTGGGSLSHAAITTRELGIPSVILPSARWRKDSGQGPMLGVQLSRRRPSERVDGVLEIAELSAAKDPYLREGDLVRLYGQEGKIALIARADDAALQKAYAALEAVRSGIAEKLEWDPGWDERVERFLLEELRSNPRYSEARFKLFNSLSANAKHLPATGLSMFPPASGADAAKNHAASQSGGMDASSPSARPLWRALARRLSMTRDPGKKGRLLELLRRLLRKNGAAAKQGVDLLFVCMGNTCRSPMAEQITRQVLAREGIEGVRAASRGFESFLDGLGMAPQAQQALADIGFNPEPHTVQGLSAQDVRSADIILTMEESLGRMIVKAHPEAAPKIMLLNRFAGRGDAPILDPLFGPALFPERPSGKDAPPVSVDPWEGPIPSFADTYVAAAKDILAAVEASLGQITSFLHLKSLDAQAREQRLLEVLRQEPSFLDLADIDDDMKPLAGGKSAKLGEMLQALRGQDAYVPEGLALTIYAYKRFLTEAGLEDKVRALAMELDALLNAPGAIAGPAGANLTESGSHTPRWGRSPGGTPDDRAAGWNAGPAGMDEANRSKEISRLSERIRQVLMSAKLDAEKGVGRDILEALKPHGFEDAAGRWSVRSSAIQEDSDDAAFAGAAESYLNLKPEEVLVKVVENWASFWLPRGILYRQRQGLRSVDLLPATLIQKMAPAVVSGVIFTRNPVNGKDEVVINAAYGLGEGVVSGQAAADVYVTRKWDGQESELPHVARKRWQVEARPEGFGTRLGPVPAESRGLRALSSEQTRRLTRVAAALEKRFGKAMDIEFSLLADGTIVILQARPITTY